ncbi:MAG: hypothetical protein ABIT01_18205 [Thermoanaerobaculia bacterium]
MKRACAGALAGVLLLRSERATAGALRVRVDPRHRDTILVSFPRDGKSLPLDVIWFPAPGGAKPASFRSPNPESIDICAFLRAAGAVATKGPLDVVVRRGDAEARVNLTYDGRSCAPLIATGGSPDDPGAATPRSRTSGQKVAAPAPPAPFVVQRPEREPARPADARSPEGTLRVKDGWLHFEVTFDRPVRIADRSSVIVDRFQRRVLGGKSSFKKRSVFPVTLRRQRVLEWKVSAPLAGLDPPLQAGETVLVNFELDGASFEAIPFRIEVEP